MEIAPIICAWCGRKMGEQISSSSMPSHGICNKCFKKLFNSNSGKKELKRIGKIKKKNGIIVEIMEKWR